MLNWFRRLFAEKPLIYEEGTHYKFVVEFEYVGLLTIEILKGPYKDVVFAITNVSVLNNYGKTTYNYEVCRGSIDRNFDVVADAILLDAIQHIIQNRVDVSKEVLSDEADRDDYFEESDSQRIVLQKGSSIFKK